MQAGARRKCTRQQRQGPQLRAGGIRAPVVLDSSQDAVWRNIALTGPSVGGDVRYQFETAERTPPSPLPTRRMNDSGLQLSRRGICWSALEGLS